MPSPQSSTIPDSHTCVVDVEEFRHLLTCRHRLLRSDDPDGGMRGLLDPDTGIRYVIRVQELSALTRTVRRF